MKRLFPKLLILPIFILFVTSCDVFNDTEGSGGTNDRFTIDYETNTTFALEDINNNLTLFSYLYPSIDIEEISNNVKYGVTVYILTYNTIINKEIKRASGLVCVPMGDGSFPILSYQNGTNTKHSNAPSENPGDPSFQLLEMLASTGFIVIIPDYLGFGASDDMFHPYLDRTSTVRTVLDMVRATKEFANNHINVSVSDDLYIAGYSQGGWSTMQVAKEIEQKYSNEFDLKANASGAGPYDLNYINEYVINQTTYPAPYFLGYMFNSYVNLGLPTPIDEIIQEPYATKIMTLYDGEHSGSQISDQLTTNISSFFTADYLANYGPDGDYAPVDSMLLANSVAAWETTTPTLIIHGMNDTFVPKEVSTAIYQDFLALGVRQEEVTWMPLVGMDHDDGVVPAGIASINFFLEIRGE